MNPDDEAREENEQRDGVLPDDEDDGFSLEELSQAYSQLVPYDPTKSDNGELADQTLDDQQSEKADVCPVSPLSVLEAMLFVGNPDGELSAEELAAQMRGVEVAEISEYVEQLNAIYEKTGRAMRVALVGAGYKMKLADDLLFLTQRFYGPQREVKLPQQAIDCIALIAYQPGISREELDEQRGQPSGGVLSQLVRRQLVEIRRFGEKPTRKVCYYPTEKLLALVGLSSLEDLPRVEG